MNLLKGIIDDKTLRVLSVFMNNPDEFYHINKVSLASKVSLATTFRIMNMLSKNEIIEYKKISKFKIYKLSDSERTKKLRKIL